MGKLAFLVCFLFQCLLSINAQEYYFERIGTIEGENNLSARKIVQDEKGVIWIATFNGLYRYEGGEFIVKHNFRHNQIINPDVTALLLDKANNLWIGTDRGLSKYNLESEQLTAFDDEDEISDSVQNERIRALALDSSGNVWIGTRDSGLKIYNHLTREFLSVDFNLLKVKAPTHVKTIHIPNDSTIWLGTLYNGLYRLSVSGCKVLNANQYAVADSFVESSVHTVFSDRDYQVIVGTDQGLFVYGTPNNNIREIHPLQVSKGSQSNFYKKIARDNHGKYWIGTYDGLLVCQTLDELESGHFSFFKHSQGINHSLSHNQILDVFQDKSGVTWIGTENGLNKFDPYRSQFHPLVGSALQGISEKSATAFQPYNNGMLLLTLSDGLFFKKGNEIISFSNDLKSITDLGNEKFYSMFVDSNKDIWLGSYSGLLVRLNSIGAFRDKYKISKEGSPIYSIEGLDENTLLIGTGSHRGRLSRFNIKTSIASVDSGLERNLEINKVHIDLKGNVWLVTQQGVFLKKDKGGSYEEFLPENPISVVSPNIFNDIAESASGEIFVGGRNGLYRYNENQNRFDKLSLNSIPNLWITNLQFDNLGVLWLNLNFNRIASWDPNSGQTLLFSVDNGVRSSPVNHRGFSIDKDNVLYFSGFDQLYYCNTDKIEIDTYTPPPFLTELMINNTVIAAGDSINNQVVLEKNISYQTDLTLSYENRNFTLTFSNGALRVSRNIKYRYKLHGYDKDWIIGQTRSVQYIGLKSGKYVFEIFCTNSYGVWSKESLVLPIRIKPSPFLTFWAFCIYLTLFLIVAYLINRVYVIRGRLKRELVVEKVKREKEEAFHQERLRFYTNISHELRTPLTLIIGPVEKMIDNEIGGSEKSKMLGLVYDNSKRLLALLNQLLDFRKSLFEGVKLGVTKINLVHVVESNISAFGYMAKDKSLTVQFENECNDSVVGWCDHEKLDSILFNVLSNAFKHTPKRGSIVVNLSTGVCVDIGLVSIIIKVTNSGNGIPKHLQDKIFERFYKIDDKDDVYRGAGFGIGLSIVKKMVELHRGNITVESEVGVYARFTIALPIDRESYFDNEIFDFDKGADVVTNLVVPVSNSVGIERAAAGNSDEKRKLLLVEDNVGLREFLTDYLANEFEVFVASDGVAGFDICEKEMPDLVVSDVMMDNMSGFEFCEKIKTSARISHIPIVLMTALVSTENVIKGYKLGADDYISKPFEPELLKIRLVNLLENRAKARNQFLQSYHVSAKELTVSKIDEDFMDGLIKLLDKYLKHEGLDVDLICKEVGVSSSHLYRKIKGITGLSPMEFMNSYKLNKACRLLVETNMNISEISYEIGLGNPNYFSRLFKKHFHTTPSRYRDTHK